MTLPVIFSSAALPIMSSEIGMPQHSGGFGKVMHINQRLSIAIALPLSTVIMFLGDWIMRLYGRDFVDGTPILIGIVLAMAIAAIGNVTGSAIQARGHMWFGTLQNVSRGAILLGFVWLGAAPWGARAYALGMAVAYLIVTGWAFAYLRRDLPEGMLRQTALPVVYVVLLAGICLVLTPIQRLSVSIPALLTSCLVSASIAGVLPRRKAIYR